MNPEVKHLPAKVSVLRHRQARFPSQHLRSPVYSELHGLLESSGANSEGHCCGFLPSQARPQSSELHYFLGEGTGAKGKGSDVPSATQHEVKKFRSRHPNFPRQRRKPQKSRKGLGTVFNHLPKQAQLCLKMPQKRPHCSASPCPRKEWLRAL